MKNETIKIGGVTFVLKGKDVNFVPYRKDISLFDCYEKPSKTKIEIFNYWKSWFLRNSEFYDDFICIKSFNVYQFTLNGVITINNVRYKFLITSTRREFYEI